jgi:hypothetical protein
VVVGIIECVLNFIVREKHTLGINFIVFWIVEVDLLLFFFSFCFLTVEDYGLGVSVLSLWNMDLVDDFMYVSQ